MDKEYLENFTYKIFNEIKSSKDIIDDDTTDYIKEYLNGTLERNEINKEKLILILTTIRDEKIGIDDLDPLRIQETYDYDLVLNYISNNFIENNNSSMDI